MKTRLFVFIVSLLISTSVYSQEKPLEKFNSLIGKWEGAGSGFSSSKSVIQSEFSWVMNNEFIEVKNRSEFEPTPQKPEGEIHEDSGIISYDKARKLYVIRQFHVEGFVNQYILNNTLSNENKLIFESKSIDNFVPGGTARFTIIIKNPSEIETIFDVGFPGKEMSCFGNNQLKRK